MGVPGLFRWVRLRTKGVIDGLAADPDDPDRVRYYDHVYLDFNGCIHGCLDHVRSELATSDAAEIEEVIFEQVEIELRRLFRCVLPTLCLYVALDGVAPRSKANQQRTRRYRSAMDTEKAGGGSGFDRNSITAGTPFMNRLTQYLKDWAAKAAVSDSRLRGVAIVVSGDDCPGEGEHKIMDAVRRRSKTHPGESHCLLGADADLLLLGLASQVKYFYVLREQFKDGGHNGTFDVLRIAALREYLTEVRWPERDPVRAVEDFIGLCCLAGNDFLPALAPCRLELDGLDRVLSAYEARFPTWGSDAFLFEVDEVDGGRRMVGARWEEVLAILSEYEKESALDAMGLGLGKPPKDPPGGHPPPPDDRWDGFTCVLTNVPPGAALDELETACRPPEGKGSVKVTELVEEEEVVDEVAESNETSKIDSVGQGLEDGKEETETVSTDAPDAAEKTTDKVPRRAKGNKKGKGKGKGKGKHQKGGWGRGHQRYIARFETVDAAVKTLACGPRWVKGSRIVCSAHMEDTGSSADNQEWQSKLAPHVIQNFEFWFGPKNLPNDAFLRRHTRRSGRERYVPISKVLKFAKMRSVCQDPEEVAKMLKASENLEVRLSPEGEWEVRGVADHSAKPTETEEIVASQEALVAALDANKPEEAAALMHRIYYAETVKDAPVAAGVPSMDDLAGRAACWSRAYLRGIEWVLRYYIGGVAAAEGADASTGGTASWQWFYPSHYPPLCADVRMACCNHDKWGTGCDIAGLPHASSEAEAPSAARERQRLALSPDGPFSPDVFLLSVLPPQGCGLHPNPSLHSFLGDASSPMADCFPRSVEVRWPPGANPEKVQEHQQLVLVPFIEENRLCQEMRKATSWSGGTRSPAMDGTSFRQIAKDDKVSSSSFRPGVSELRRDSQTLLFVTNCMEEQMGVSDRACASRWSKWHSADFKAEHEKLGAIRDPSLTEMGVLQADKGLDEKRRTALNAKDGHFGGVARGLRSVGDQFFPELIVTSPLSRSLQTALVMFDRCKAPIIVHNAIREIVDDDTEGDKHPDGEPRYQGMTRGMLQSAVDNHPRSGGGLVDLSHLREDAWYDPKQSMSDKLKELDDFGKWLRSRKERRIAVVSHASLLQRWINADFGQAEIASGELSDDGSTAGRVVITRCSEGVNLLTTSANL